MSTPTPKAARVETTGSTAKILFPEFEILDSLAFQAFEQQFELELAELEEKFNSYVTRNSLVESIGR